jgi:hypothetical protein
MQTDFYLLDSLQQFVTDRHFRHPFVGLLTRSLPDQCSNPKKISLFSEQPVLPSLPSTLPLL